MRKCRVNRRILAERRERLGQMIPDAAFILVAQPECIRNRDVHHHYRQESSFYYYTGFEEPESVMVFRPGLTPEYVLFVRPKDVERETWDGFRFGPDGAITEFDADQAYSIDDLEKVLPELLLPVEQVYYQMNLHKEFDGEFLRLLQKVQAKKGRGATRLPDIVDPSEAIGEMRLRKKPDEVELLRKAGEISAQGHLAAMKYVKPGVSEREVLAVINYTFLMGDAAREGYGGIVASGANATTLHYTFNDQICQDGDLILIDAGAEYEYYTGDITRTFPVNGRFTDVQKKFYEKVLHVQKAIIEMSRPGLVFTALQERAIDMLTSAMLDLGLLKGNKKDLIDSLAFKKYYPHGVSHFLGMDVHDVGALTVHGEPRVLEPGMCYTVEPGLYVPANDMDAPPELRGLGVRIEDDILITERGCEVLTDLVPKEVRDIEELMSAGR